MIDPKPDGETTNVGRLLRIGRLDFTEETKAAFEGWIYTRPKSVQKLAREFPPGTCLVFERETLYVVAYTEDDFLQVSDFDPVDRYEEAVRSRFGIHADCVRGRS